MKAWLLIGTLILFTLSAAPIFAQDTSTPAPPTPVSAAAPALDVSEAERILQHAQQTLEEAQEAQADAEAAMERAGELSDLGFNLLGLFEAFGLIISLLAVGAGVFGFRQLRTLQTRLDNAINKFETDLADARIRFAAELKEGENELTSMRDQLMRSADDATLALSLLPLGERQYKFKDFNGALDTYRRALELDPDNPLIYYRIGYVYVHSGKLDEAEQYLTGALKQDEAFVPAMAALGYTYRRKGEKLPVGIERNEMFNRAEQYLLKALSTSPKLVDDDDESWWGSLGGLYKRRGQIDSAIYAYAQAGEVTPHSSYPFSNLALLYRDRNDLEGMMRMYKRVERLAIGETQSKIDNYWAYADLLTARLALGKQKEAEEVLEYVLDTAPTTDSSYALNMLIDTLTRLTAALGGEEKAPHIKPVIEKLQAEIAQREKTSTSQSII
jgi:tetratricopeptide (TPR) repeat protein